MCVSATRRETMQQNLRCRIYAELCVQNWPRRARGAAQPRSRALLCMRPHVPRSSSSGSNATPQLALALASALRRRAHERLEPNVAHPHADPRRHNKPVCQRIRAERPAAPRSKNIKSGRLPITVSPAFRPCLLPCACAHAARPDVPEPPAAGRGPAWANRRASTAARQPTCTPPPPK